MKKATLLTFTALIVLSLLLSACGNRAGRSENASNTVSESETYKEVLEFPTHLAPEEPSETKADSLPETEASTKEIESETIRETAETLRFTSYGNGTCAVSGIGSCTDLFVVIPERSPDGDVVTYVEERAFYGNRQVKAFELPSTVTGIGDLAFADCPSLVYISVDKSNKEFIDKNGILYTKDLKELIVYPSACGASLLELSVSLERIADMAFYGCDTLESIHYEGTLSDWGKIRIGEMNYGLFTASVSCGAEK